MKQKVKRAFKCLQFYWYSHSISCFCAEKSGLPQNYTFISCEICSRTSAVFFGVIHTFKYYTGIWHVLQCFFPFAGRSRHPSGCRQFLVRTFSCAASSAPAPGFQGNRNKFRCIEKPQMDGMSAQSPAYDYCLPSLGRQFPGVLRKQKGLR